MITLRHPKFAARPLLAACAAALVVASIQEAAAESPDAARVGPPRVPRRIVLVDGDVVGDPGFTPQSAADSPATTSGPFDAARGDIGEDDDLSRAERRRRRAAMTGDVPTADPLAGTPKIDPATTGVDAAKMLATMLPPRSDSPVDWHAPVEPLHHCGEPRALSPCVPPPPCHPSQPPQPFDLVGDPGAASCGPIYDGPCAPRTGRHEGGSFSWLHALHDRLFDRFYATR